MATSDGSSSESFPAEPHQPRSFNFPKREFGKKTVVKRSFNPSWFERYKWLHYDEAQDAAFCHVCRCAADQRRLITSHSVLNILRRSLRGCSKIAKAKAYTALVRPHLEFCVQVWSPHQKCATDELEKVQKRAARWICAKWNRNHLVVFVPCISGFKW